VIVVFGHMRAPIFEVGCPQLTSIGHEIIKPPVPQRFEVDQVADIFLNRPSTLTPNRDRFLSQTSNQVFQLIRRCSEPIENSRKGFYRKPEVKLSIEQHLSWVARIHLLHAGQDRKAR